MAGGDVVHLSTASGPGETHEWVQTAGVRVELSDPRAARPTFVAPSGLVNSNLRFELRAVDTVPAVRASVEITVDALEGAPRAVAGPDQFVEEGTSVTLIGSGSRPNPRGLKYSWQQVRGLFVPLVDDSAPNSTIFIPEGLVNSALTFELRVSDGTRSSADTVTILINARDDAPRAYAGPDRTVEAGEQVVLAASGAHPGGAEVLHTWIQVSGPSVRLSDPYVSRPMFTVPEALVGDEAVFELYVSQGDTASVDTVRLWGRAVERAG